MDTPETPTLDRSPAAVATCGVDSVEIEGSLGSLDDVPIPEDYCIVEGCVNDGCTSSVVNDSGP